MEMSCNNDEKRIESPYTETSRENDPKKNKQKRQIPAPKSFFNFFCQQIFTFSSYRSAISFTSRFQHYCFLGQVNLYRFCGLRKLSRQVKLKKIKRDNNRGFRPVQNVTMGDEGFNQFMQLKNQLPIPAENFG